MTFFEQNIFNVNDFTDVDIFTELSLAKERNSQDNVVNGYGKKLIDFCKNNNMFILNGRFGNDKVGKPTCKNSSVIDYVISTTALIRVMCNFEVCEFSQLFSDVHSPVTFEIEIDYFSAVDNSKSVDLTSKLKNGSMKRKMISLET